MTDENTPRERLTDAEAKWLEECVGTAAKNRKRGKGYGWSAHATEKAIAARLFGTEQMLPKLLAERRELKAALGEVYDDPHATITLGALDRIRALLWREGGA